MHSIELEAKEWNHVIQSLHINLMWIYIAISDFCNEQNPKSNERGDSREEKKREKIINSVLCLSCTFASCAFQCLAGARPF